MQQWATSSPHRRLLSSSAVKALILALANVGAGHLVDNTRPTQHDSALLLEDMSRSALKEDDMEGIINGNVVDRPSKKYPYFAMPVAHQDQKTWLGCGASIISPTHAITAAHCYGGGNNVCGEHHKIALMIGDVKLRGDTVVGMTPGRFATIPEATRTCHPEFDGKCSHGHDIVLLKFETALPDWFQPVILDLHHEPEHDQDKQVIAIGFGNKEGDAPDEVGDISPQLREATLTLQSMSAHACHKVYKGGWGCSDEASEAPGTNEEQQVCAWSDDMKDTCAGDSGSPLLLRESSGKAGAQIGITSYGGGPGVVLKGPGRSCGDKNFPGLYSRVSAFKEFICDNVHDLPDETKSQCSSHHPQPCEKGGLVRRGE